MRSREILTAILLLSCCVAPAIAQQRKDVRSAPPRQVHPSRPAVHHQPMAPRIQPRLSNGPNRIALPQRNIGTGPAIKGPAIKAPTMVRVAPGVPEQRIRAHNVHRAVARRIAIAGGVLLLPVVAYYGVPVVIDVPQVGYVEIPESEYARLYAELAAENAQVEELLAILRRYKTARPPPDCDVDCGTAETSAPIVRVPQRTSDEPVPDGPDFSEALSFDNPPPKTVRQPQRLY